MSFRRIVLIDFDGTLHSYSSGWQGHDVVSDPPVAGAVAWLREMLANPNIEPQIYSARSLHAAGIGAMKDWLVKHGMTAEEVDGIKFPTEKPPAFVTLDDRAICFNGKFPEPDDILNFQPWYSMWPKWTRYADDEGAKFGIRTKLPPKPDKHSLVIFDELSSRTIKLDRSEANLHHSMIEPKIRAHLRIAAVEFQRVRDQAAGKPPRPFCNEHRCHHVPGEPLCPEEERFYAWHAKQAAEKTGEA